MTFLPIPEFREQLITAGDREKRSRANLLESLLG
jgi:hypothetical protein